MTQHYSYYELCDRAQIQPEKFGQTIMERAKYIAHKLKFLGREVDITEEEIVEAVKEVYDGYERYCD